jgi:predicted nucleotidyltransferase
MGIDDSLAHELVRRMLTAAHPGRIILFGSAASGTMTADSDLDLLVVEPQPGNQRGYEAA